MDENLRKATELRKLKETAENSAKSIAYLEKIAAQNDEILHRLGKLMLSGGRAEDEGLAESNEAATPSPKGTKKR